MPQRLRSILLPLTALSWLLLLLSALSHSGAGSWLGVWPQWATQLAQGAFVLGVFLLYRYHRSPLQGQAFVRLLKQLLLGPGLLALVCIGLHLFERLLEPDAGAGKASILFTSVYTVNLALFVIFLARTNYAWRALVLFRSTPRLQREWTIFEVLLGATLLFRLVGVNPPNYLTYPLMAGLGLFGVYLSGHQKWVAYLSQREKWRAVAFQAGLLFSLLVFVQYFRVTQVDPQLIAPQPQYAFLLLTAFFSAFYALMGLLVTFFNMPIADVIEQRRNEILRLQRLTQIIQRGQTTTEVYRILLESAVQTAQADAAWLDLDPVHAGIDAADATQYYNFTQAQADAMRPRLQGHELPEGEHITNDLHTRAGFEGPAQLYRSLLQLPLRGLHFNYGMLYLLKTEPHTFDREDLSILQTFTSQAVLSIENLELVRTSLANQRTQEELKIASQVQDSLIPKNLPTDNWFDISSHSLAAKEVGGDFYDFLHLQGRRLAVIIGDVSGKGVTAAFHMAQMKGIFHSLMQENPLAKNERDKFPVPSKFMAQANTALTHCLEKSSFITSSLYIIDYEQGGFVFARAGHCHTLYYHALREEVFYFESQGLGLGIIRNESYEKHIKNQFYDYSPGDVMVIYTDGIVEARGGDGTEEYGEDRLKLRLEESYFQEAEEIKNFILDDLNSFTHGHPIHDDQTLLVIKFKSAQPLPLA
ncbi:PP2C family protein-serine/threonine phosphatase [Hymenobacter properus]|uniref:SpoIIE family protein phosphatase n=1 Tax=Hymenobacter properus TaxID=2791026 RepID=A0A931BFJ3_9BACT|nr:GAF domain-containing SpoIIE family protein phosphatase [Hymenobacter properus]MBF9141362.1 SpoIIE family protein phosphatase [Hymenobacter properus]MBR7720172.1 SpoIIE family protein phosphatase [Microvirga sp. SRT04]